MLVDPCEMAGMLLTLPERRGSRRAGNGQFLQVVHEDLQADVVSQNGSPRLLLHRNGQTKGTIM